MNNQIRLTKMKMEQVKTGNSALNMIEFIITYNNSRVFDLCAVVSL